MIELLNLSDVVVLNGVQKARAQYTCRAARGDGIDDYIAVSGALVERTSELEYWIENQVESDHVAIGCSIKLKNEIRFCEKEKKRKNERVNFKMVRDNRSWKFWYWLSDICDEKMKCDRKDE